jgi:hypothetical protein
MCRCSTAYVSGLLKRRKLLAPQRKVDRFRGEVGKGRDGKLWTCECMTVYMDSWNCPLHKPHARHTLHAMCSRYVVKVLHEELFCSVLPEFNAFGTVYAETQCSTTCRLSRANSGQFSCRQQHRLDILGVSPSGTPFVVDIYDRGHNACERASRDNRTDQWCIQNNVPRLCISLQQSATCINHTVIKQMLLKFIRGEVLKSG